MPTEFDTSDSVEGSNFLDKPGTYHLFVLNAEEQPMTKDGKPIDGLRFECAVMAGTQPGQEKKTIKLTVRHPSPTHKDGGDFCLRIRSRFFWATGFLGKPGEKVVFDAEKAKGRQFIATLAAAGTDGKFLDFDGMHFWHVDDPDAAAFPKSEQALKLLPKELRRSPESFGKNGSGGAAGSAAKTDPPKTSPPTAAAKSAVNLDDL